MSQVIEKALKAVDDANKAVPPSAEVRAEADAKGSDASIAKNVRPKVKAASKAKAPKAKSAKRAKQGVTLPRVTKSWDSAKPGVEVLIGSTVKTPAIASLLIVGRWSKRPKKRAPIPFVTGTTPDGQRKNVAAADCTVTKVAAAK
jgi:hypothetical protein